MKNLTRLALTHLLSLVPHVFTSNNLKNQTAISVVVPQRHLYLVSLHLKLSTVWYSTQLVDMFAYSVPTALSRGAESGVSKYTPLSDAVVVYNFHTLFNHDRLFFFAWEGRASGSRSSVRGLSSVANLFANAAWLEREVAEMFGLSFEGKADLRNLMLPYGDVTSPMRKSFPSTGFKEVYYDVTSDALTQVPNSLQI